MGASRTSKPLVALWCVLIVAGVEHAEAASVTPQDPGRGQLYGITDRRPKLLPLTKTEVSAHIAGSVASVTVKQQFRNPNAKPLEAIYVFPLPEGAAVHGFKLTVRDKLIKGTVKKRSDVKAIYEMAKGAGKTVALLDQERPNVFTQAIANIFPKSNVEIELSFDVQLKHYDGFYAFEFPMVVGQRYIPGDPNGKPAKGWGESPDTDRVPDASKITPPQAAREKRSGRTVRLQLTLEPGAKVRELYSPTHTIKAMRLPKRSKHAMRIELASKNEIPNKDFVVRYRLANDRPAMGVVSHMDERGGFFSLRFEPPGKAAPKDVSSKEMVFVVDTSESMGGTSMDLVREAMRTAIDSLNPGDTFRIIRFSDSTGALTKSPLPNTAENRKRAHAFIGRLVASGGAEMLEAMKAALDERKSGDRLRVVSLLSNGLIGNEREVLAAVADKLGDNTRLFTFGIGAAPNRYLLERLAQLGRGSAHFLLPNEPAADQIARFYERLRSPVLTHVEIDWKGLSVEELRPSKAPDLFVGRPLAVFGRFARAGRATIEVRGRMGQRRVVYEVPVSLGRRSKKSPAIARLWAKQMVRDLELGAVSGADHEKEITELGLRYQIVTRYTSFVALAEDAAIAKGDLQTVMVPVDRVQETPARDRVEGEIQNRPTDDRTKATKRPTVKSGESRDKLGAKDRTARKPKGRDFKKEQAEKKLREDEDEEDGESQGDGDDDDDDADEDGFDDAPSPTVAVGGDGDDDGGPALDSAPMAQESVRSISLGRSSTLGHRWRLGVALGLGSTSNANADESSFASSTTLSLERVVTSRLALGTNIGLLVRGPDNDRVIGNLLLAASYLDLLGSLSDNVSLELSLGVGPSIGSDSAGLGVMGALRLRVPIPVGLQLRYDGALRFQDDAESNSTVTGGFEFSF